MLSETEGGETGGVMPSVDAEPRGAAHAVRLATYDDVPALVFMAGEFFEDDGGYWGERRTLDPVGFAKHLLSLIDRREVGFFVLDVDGEPQGWLAVAMMPNVYEGGHVAMKLHWLMSREARGRGRDLLRASENWARGRGATQIMIAALNDRSAKLLTKTGFRQLEVVYYKDLSE